MRAPVTCVPCIVTSFVWIRIMTPPRAREHHFLVYKVHTGLIPLQQKALLSPGGKWGSLLNCLGVKGLSLEPSRSSYLTDGSQLASQA